MVKAMMPVSLNPKFEVLFRISIFDVRILNS